MIRARRVFSLVLSLPLAATMLVAATQKPDPSPTEIDAIIKKFAANEAEFAKARENYTYRQTVRIQEADEAGNPGGRFEVVSDIIFPAGKRVERVVRAPMPTLRMLTLTPNDEADLRNVQPFVLTSADIDQYAVRYLGRQTVDEIDCLVFAVKPKQMEPNKRYFAGQIWVDDRDLQIVKTYGRGTGVQKRGSDEQFPKFETYREQIDGKYWFPTYTAANDLLYFKESTVALKMTVKYEDYKQFRSDVRIIDVDDDPAAGKEPKPVEPSPKKP